uniref:Ectonucleoside triphosphate diphosphohydrolase 2 n=1 Tax=Amphilophus citrinellus TaxID=61819 RepID=A0A3Q0SUJ2_AMPCI
FMAQRAAHLVPVAVLVFGLVGILLLTIPTKDVQEEPGLRYGIVLDAGSSHTSLYIYKWPGNKQNGTAVVTQHSKCHAEGGGIASYAGQLGAAGKSLEAFNAYLSAQILKEVSHKIQSYPFDYRGAAILSGKEEGAYGWVTVNYLSENFIKYGFEGHWFSPSRPTVGALDLGGASTQITFATQEKIEDTDDLMKLRLYGHEYTLYTHSFLCYGKDQFLKRLLAHIMKSQGYPQSVAHPCYPADHSRVVKLSSILESPCTAKYKPSSYDPHASVTVHGTGHYKHCLGNVSGVFSFEGCPFSQCSFDRVFQPNVTGGFMAFSAFFYVHSFLQQVTGITASSPLELEVATKRVCNMSFSQMTLLAPEQKSRLHYYCAASVFLNALMLRGYGFNDTSFPHISFQKKVADTTVGWALGYMLSLSNLLPTERLELRKALTPGVWGSLIFLFVLLLAAVLVFFLFRAFNGQKKGGRESTI